MSPIVVITAVESGFGFLVTSLVLFLVLKHGRKAYHFLFAIFLFICVIWDLGIFTTMIRNEHVNELEMIGRIAVYPCVFIPALIFHFVNLYTGRPIKWAIILVWIMTVITWVPILAGMFYQIDGFYSYNWGNIFQVVSTVFDPIIFIVWFGLNFTSCWLLLKTATKNDFAHGKTTLSVYILRFSGSYLRNCENLNRHGNRYFIRVAIRDAIE